MATGTSPRSRVDAVLVSLRHSLRKGQQLTRDPRGAIEAAVKQLLAAGRTPAVAAPDETATTYRIDDLARATGTTVRNIRAYQERGLLHPARRVGRASVFDDTHVSRLKIITSMLDRGYTSAHIVEMLSAWEAGRDLADILGLEGALIAPQEGDSPVTTTLTAARELAGGVDELETLIAAGLAERAGNKIRVLRPKLLASFGEMREYGVPMETLLEVHAKVVPETERIARILVAAGAAYFAPHFSTDRPPTSADVELLVTMLTRFRALTLASVTSTLSVSIEDLIEQLLSEYLAAYVEKGAADTG